MGVSAKFWQMAEAFVAQVHKESGCPVIVCDEQGLIRCSSDPSRIGDAHAGAQRIMSGEVDEAFVTAQEALENPMVKEGYSCVIQTDSQRIGTFGLAGSLELAGPLARISSLVMTSWIHELHQAEQIDATAQKVFSGADRMTAQSSDLSRRTTDVFKEIETAAGHALEQIKVTDDILKIIQDISSRSNILSLNGTIEASRAGERGRAFAVVAQEMRDMAKGTKEAAATIEENLGALNASITGLSRTLDSYSGISAEQNDMVNDIIAMIAEFKTAMIQLKQD